jgi:hypothetical protein
MSINYRDLYFSIYEARNEDEREMRRLAAQERRAGKSDRMDSKSAEKYAASEKKSAEREDKKSKGKHIHGMADSVELEGDLVDEGMTMKDFKQQRSRQKQKEKRAADKLGPNRRAGIHADKASPERAARHRANVDPDFEGNDERNYPGGKLRPNKVRKAKALGELTKEAKDNSYLETDMKKRRENNEKAVEDMKKTKAHGDMVKAARKHFEEVIKEEDPCWKGYTQVGMKKKGGREVPNCVPSKGVPKAKGYKEEVEQIDEISTRLAGKVVNARIERTGAAADRENKVRTPQNVRDTVAAADKEARARKLAAGVRKRRAANEEIEIQERALDTAEKGEKERLVKGMKKSAADFKKRYGERAKSVMYATATKKAKEHMDTSKSDRRYSVEEVTMGEAAEAPEAPRKGRRPSEIAKRENLNALIAKIREKDTKG